jgi:hypothetical protein
MRDNKRVISTVLTGEKLHRGVLGRVSITGGGAVDVVARILSILEVKCIMNWSAVKFVSCGDGGDSRSFSFDQRARVSLPQDVIDANQ